ncbi:urea ABC transporter permease subunit UrtB [Paucibacter sp. APW11]|uniref:Urea ABC transporter permease subunit UrtB n=1 Tax=Roseateles aquae TaxID=3077235 RepID=A0ABU3PG19_9BURK|nr:urea ABC transporter permease subunit UrtB [Paucibacter sp. APW11]MDT9001473.1 urea ABC transporter permease subunit UrtB [Paucibacter sp. APW11]
MKACWRTWAASLTALLLLSPCWALTAQQAQTLARGEDGDVRVAALHEALQAHAQQPDARLQPFLQALADEQLKLDGERLLIQRGDGALLDALSGLPVALSPEAALEDVSVNNRLRGELDQALAVLQLFTPEAKRRLAAAQALQKAPSEAHLPLIERALAAESEAPVRAALDLARAAALLGSAEPVRRLQAARDLAQAPSAATELLLNERLAEEGDARVKTALQTALQKLRETLAWGERLGALFTGLSLGSILLLVALGLAITYGLMGVINMAHGELMMIGAYATWAVQAGLRHWLPPALFDYYLLLALPCAFGAAALVGALMERLVLRWLYGRPLETLLATWGISLVLMQTVRSLFGAQNLGVENPGWMSGSLVPLPALLPNLSLPINRLLITGFAAAVLAGMTLLIQRTRLGLFVRGVTQNRAMAACMGVNTARIDCYAFALGSGIAGLAGCALSQIGNVGPDLGQSYIVDAFMVVVLGGVGQLAGSVYAALGLGLANKALEGMVGAVLAKIAVLIFIIVFIQKRPQGIFAAKGRT